MPESSQKVEGYINRFSSNEISPGVGRVASARPQEEAPTGDSVFLELREEHAEIMSIEYGPAG